MGERRPLVEDRPVVVQFAARLVEDARAAEIVLIDGGVGRRRVGKTGLQWPKVMPGDVLQMIDLLGVLLLEQEPSEFRRRRKGEFVRKRPHGGVRIFQPFDGQHGRGEEMIFDAQPEVVA